MGSYRRHDGGAHGDAAGLSQLAHGVHLDEGDALPHRLLHQRLEELYSEAYLGSASLAM